MAGFDGGAGEEQVVVLLRGGRENSGGMGRAEAERLGFDSMWTSEAYGSDCFSPLAWWGSETERLRLGTAITQMSARQPAATAMAAMTMDHLSGGRFILGLGPSGGVAGPITAFVALCFAGIGLASSTFHLGNPQRALKAFTQWRSSWLSREGCVSVVLMTLFFVFTVLWWLGDRNAILGVICAALAILAIICTAMIYGQLKTVPRWNSVWTVPMFLGFAGAGGLLATSAASAMAGEAIDVSIGMGLLAFSALIYIYRRSMPMNTLAAAGHSPESATQLGRIGRVRLLEPPHSSPNYLMKEMVHQIGRKHAEKLGLIAVIAGIFAPLFLLVLFRTPSAMQVPMLVLALVLHYGGALASRWLFFAEAQHVVGLYYGQR